MKRGLWLAFAVLLLHGCGSDDDPVETRHEVVEQHRTFASPRIPFTFDYPKDLVAEKKPREDVLAEVAAERGSRLNAIKVRRTARRELEPGRYLEEFRRDFERSVGAVEKRRERIGDLDLGVLEFETPKFSSSSYFFTGGGQTWQVECISDPEHRAAIDAACKTALESVTWRR